MSIMEAVHISETKRWGEWRAIGCRVINANVTRSRSYEFVVGLKIHVSLIGQNSRVNLWPFAVYWFKCLAIMIEWIQWYSTIMTIVFLRIIVPRTHAKLSPKTCLIGTKCAASTQVYASVIPSKYHWDTLRIGWIIAVEKQNPGHAFM